MAVYSKTSVKLTEKANGQKRVLYVTLPSFNNNIEMYFQFRTTVTEIIDSFEPELTVNYLISPTILFGQYVMNSKMITCICCKEDDVSGIECQLKQITPEEEPSDAEWELATFCPECAKKFELSLYSVVFDKFPEYFVSSGI